MFPAALLLPAALLASCNKDEAAQAAVAAKQQAAGGGKFVVRVQPAEGRGVTPDALRQAGAILDKRLDPLGALDVAITPQGADRLEIFVPGMTEEAAQEAKEVIEKVARLQFRLLGPDGHQTTTAEDTEIRPGYVKLRYVDDDEKKLPRAQRNKFVWVKNKAELSGKSVQYAVPDIQPGATSYMIHVDLDDADGDKMMAITKAHTGQPLAICVENTPGEFEIISAPVIMGVFGANFQITGRFSEAEARTLASQLMNPLENPLIVEQTSVLPPAAPPSP